MFTILFGLHFALRAVIDWVWHKDNDEEEEGDFDVSGTKESKIELDFDVTVSSTKDRERADTKDSEETQYKNKVWRFKGDKNKDKDTFKGTGRALDGDKPAKASGEGRSKTKLHVQKREGKILNGKDTGKLGGEPKPDAREKADTHTVSEKLEKEVRLEDEVHIKHVEVVGSRKRESVDKNGSILEDVVVPTKIAHWSERKPLRKAELPRHHGDDAATRKRELQDRNNSAGDEIVVPVKVAHLSTTISEQETQNSFDMSKVHGYEEMPYLSDEDTVNFIKRSHTMFIMRGLPGSGKSSLVKCLQDIYKESVAVCSADDYFHNSDGTYNFNAGKLPDAHKFCQDKAADHCHAGTRVVVIDNTNIQRWEMSFYMKLAQNQYYYHVVIVEPKSPWKYDPEELAKRNRHNVNIDLIAKRLQSLKDNVLSPLYYGWFLCKDDSAMLVRKCRDVLKQCASEVAWPDLKSQDVSDSFSALDDISQNFVISYTDPVPMLHCTAAYLARRSKDAYHTNEDVVRALGRKFGLCISGFVYSKQAISARVILRENPSNSVLEKLESGLKDVSVNSAAVNNESIKNESRETDVKLSLYMKEEEENLREKYKDVHLGRPESDAKHALFHHGSSAHITISYATEGQSKRSGENILNILELEFYGKVKEKKTNIGIVSSYGNDLFQVQLNEPFEVNCLFQGFYSVYSSRR